MPLLSQEFVDRYLNAGTMPLWRLRQYLYGLFILEMILITWKRGLFGPYVSTVVLFLIQVAIALIPIVLSLRSRDKKQQNKEQQEVDKQHLLFWMVTITVVFSVISFWMVADIIQRTPLSLKTSDILPVIKEVYVKRFVAGEYIYEKAYNFTGDTYATPNYFTFMWLPFVLPYKAGVDFRWFSFGFYWLVSVVVIFKLLWEDKEAVRYRIFKMILFYSVTLLFLKYDAGTFGHTVEPLIAGYYLLLFYALKKGRFWLMLIALLLTLLSRYSILFLVPFLLYHLYLQNKRKAWWMLVLLVAGFFLFYFIPFLKGNVQVIFDGLKGYDVAALGEWQGQYWQKPGDNPFQLFRGLGFAAFFYKWIPGSLETKFHALKIAFFLVSVLSAVIPLFYLKKLRKVMDDPLISLSAVKFYFAFFYTFITVPYGYLFMVPLLLSFFIVSSFPLGNTDDTFSSV
jgi:hypothetical protein